MLLAGLSVTLAAACSTTVDGRATFAGGAGPTTSRPSETAPTTTASATPSGGTGRETLSCSRGKVVSPAGAPYCYLIPTGFTDVSKSVTVDTSVGNEKYRSAVAVADRDLVIVTVYELRLDTDPIPDASLESELKTVLAQLAARGFTFDSTSADKTTVDGARSFGYHAREAKNSLQANVYFLFRGKTEVEVNCQWQEKGPDVQRACQQVLGSLQIKTVM